jgi:hypothetical protein
MKLRARAIGIGESEDGECGGGMVIRHDIA